MEQQKDTALNLNDLKGQDSKNGSSILINQGHSTVPSLSYRTEKLITGLYMVTDCITEEDPIRWKLRTLGVELMSHMHTLSRLLPVHTHISIRESKDRIQEIIALLQLAETVGLIGSMNGRILNTEFNNLIAFCSQKLSSSEVPFLQDQFFKSDGIESFVIPHDGDNSDSKGQTVHSTQSDSPLNSKKNDQNNGLKDKNLSNTKSADIALKHERRITILKIIKDKVSVTVKDISSIIKNCSEKTLQRELLSLVSEGILKKTGDKRWSRYSLKS